MHICHLLNPESALRRQAELQRIEAIKTFTKYSQLVNTSNSDLSDELKYHEIVFKLTGFTVTQANWTAHVLQLLTLHPTLGLARRRQRFGRR